jgi:hypothetical protein
MKTFWIFLLTLTLGFVARATPLDDKIKSFADALKDSNAGQAGADPNMAFRMSGMAAQLAGSQGNEASLEMVVRQLMATDSADSVQKTGTALIEELDARKKARADAFDAQFQAVVARAPDILTKAQKTEDLDGLLSDLQKIQGPRGGEYGNDQDSQALLNRVNSTYQFVSQWQDYLSARNSGNIQEGQNILRNLLNSRAQGEALLIPRSKILARTVELGSAPKPAVPGAPAPVAPQNAETTILDGIKTLDDLKPALNALRATNNQNYGFEQLSQIATLYAEAKDGLPVSLDIPMGGNPTPDLERIKSMLFLYLVPRFIGAGAETPNPNETLSDYLQRSIDTAAGKQDWVTLQRTVLAEAKVTKTQGGSTIGTVNFLSGLSQDLAGQFAQAVYSYQTALRNPDEYLPLKVAGDRLASIKKDHPAEFEEGMKRFITPPAYANPFMMRSGMPGYPVSNPGPPTVVSTNLPPSAPAPPPAPPNPAAKR